MPTAIATSKPVRIMLFSTFITLSETVAASVMLAGTDRSILPGPSVITSICPRPTRTEKAPKVRAACASPTVLAPPVNRMVTRNTLAAAMKDQIQVREKSVASVVMFFPSGLRRD